MNICRKQEVLFRMNESYVECLVAQETPAVKKFLYYLLFLLTIACLLLGLVMLPALILAVVFGVLTFFFYQQTDLEYEYLYVDKEVSIDRVIHKNKRKKMGTYGIDRMVAFAPVHSYHLDAYKNAQFAEKDYSIGKAGKPDARYAFIFEGKEKLILSPSREFVDALKSVAPRKVFTD